MGFFSRRRCPELAEELAHLLTISGHAALAEQVPGLKLPGSSSGFHFGSIVHVGGILGSQGEVLAGPIPPCEFRCRYKTVLSDSVCRCLMS
jgi:hypothetical protein